MTFEEARQYIKDHPKEYLSGYHNITISRNEHSKCPYCGGSNQTDRFSIKSDKIMHCFSCGFHGDTLDLIAIDNDLNIKRDFQKVIKIGCTYFCLSIEDEKIPYRKEIKKQKQAQKVIKGYQTPKHYDFTDIIFKVHENVSQTDYFIKVRGFSQQIIDKYKLGFSLTGYNSLLKDYQELQSKSKQQNCYQYVIPVLNVDDTCNYFLVRANKQLKADQYNKKVMNMKNIDQKNPVRLFNDRYIIEWESYKLDTLFLVEGWSDALSIEDIGYYALALNSVGNINRFISLCETYKPKGIKFIVSLDNDDAGKRDKELLNELLKRAYSAAIENINGNYKDPNDYFLQDRKGFQDALYKAVSPMKEKTIFYTPVNVMDNSYYITLSDKTKKVSNFVMKPLSLISGEHGGEYVIAFSCSNGRTVTKQFKSTVFSNVLFIHGTAGSGKSDTISHILMQIFGLLHEPLSCSNIKDFALMKSCSSSNLIYFL